MSVFDGLLPEGILGSLPEGSVAHVKKGLTGSKHCLPEFMLHAGLFASGSSSKQTSRRSGMAKRR